MLDKKKFANYISKLELAFEHRGFSLSEKALTVWYDRMKDLEEEEFVHCINGCIDNCEGFPSIAAVLKHKATENKMSKEEVEEANKRYKATMEAIKRGEM